MNPPAAPASSDEPPLRDTKGGPNSATDDESTGLPGFRTWAGVYWFVFGSFVVWVVLLTLLTKAVS